MQGGAPMQQPQAMPPQQANIPPQNNAQQPTAANRAQKSKTDQSTTQKSLLFSEIREDIVIMNDGGFRAVIECESINFDLMSDRERESIEYAYQNFLNSLNFDVQILIRSQRIDISPYLNKISDLRRAQDNMLLGALMENYINFIDDLSYGANIMDKSFYIIIPHAITADVNKVVEKGKGFFANLFSAGGQKTISSISNEDFQKAKSDINDKVNLVFAGMGQIGVQSKRLSTRQLSELYYNFYNPDTAVREPIEATDAIGSLYVKKAPQGSNTNQGGY